MPAINKTIDRAGHFKNWDASQDLDPNDERWPMTLVERVRGIFDHAPWRIPRQSCDLDIRANGRVEVVDDKPNEQHRKRVVKPNSMRPCDLIPPLPGQPVGPRARKMIH